ncbi:MAG: hypothetical protein KC657_05565 [Myxococcales bacterium]|nr:hypothetical protein [Myxococcales bacterium]
MLKTVQNCTNCGANLTLDDMRKTDCPYCKTVYPHHSQAAQHAQMANQVMGNLLAQQAQIQNQWRGAFGVGPVHPGPPGGPPPGMTPPVLNHPYGPPMSPYGDPNQMVHAHMAQANKMARNITLIVVVSIVASFVLVGVIVALTLFI